MKKQNKTYTVVGNRKAADVVNNNDEIVGTGYTKAEAVLVAVEVQKSGEFVAAWIEEGEPIALLPVASHPAVITRSIERDARTRQFYTVVRCDGWAI